MVWGEAGFRQKHGKLFKRENSYQARIAKEFLEIIGRGMLEESGALEEFLRGFALV